MDLERHFALTPPRLAVLGLNPHAGESGHLGREELEVIQPVIEELRAEGFNIQGPVPADTAFTPRFLKTVDVIVAMYHDQGLPVIKHVGFGNAVNMTLGLPILRTSVDHGTALGLARTGKADTGSLSAALALAVNLASARPDARSGHAWRTCRFVNASANIFCMIPASSGESSTPWRPAPASASWRSGPAAAR